MRCTFDAGSPVAVVTVSGELDLAATPVLRAAILKCLAAQPQAVLVDASGLVLVEDLHLTALSAAARHAAAWPSIPVMLCAPSPAVRAAARRLGVDRQVVLCPSVEAGRQRAARGTLPPRVSDTYPPRPECVPEARNLVVEACRTWGLSAAEPPAELIVSELVANAVQHAGTHLDLVVSRSVRNLHLAVRDGSPLPARMVGPETGRGLILVDALATHWGCTLTADGKVTWATLPAR